MKKMKLFIFTILVSMIGIAMANADTLKETLTCNYLYTSTTYGDTSLSATFNIYESGKVKYNAYITKWKGEVTKNKEDFIGWSEVSLKYLVEQGQCQPYVVVGKGEWLTWGFGYHAFLFTDHYTAELRKDSFDIGSAFILSYQTDDKTIVDNECNQEATAEVEARRQKIEKDVEAFNKLNCSREYNKCISERDRINNYIDETLEIWQAYREAGCFYSNDDTYNKDDGIYYYQVEKLRIKSITDEDAIWNQDEDINLDFGYICYKGNVPRTLQFLGIILYIIKVLVPFLIIIFGIIDIAKVLMSGKDEDMKKSATSLIKRIAIGAIIFFIPGIVNFILTQTGEYSAAIQQYQNCYNCILEPAKCEK